MIRRNEMRAGEWVVELPPATDAGIIFIGRIRTPWTCVPIGLGRTGVRSENGPRAMAPRRPGDDQVGDPA